VSRIIWGKFTSVSLNNGKLIFLTKINRERHAFLQTKWQGYLKKYIYQKQPPAEDNARFLKKTFSKSKQTNSLNKSLKNRK
jgi:hypothetical protein